MMLAATLHQRMTEHVDIFAFFAFREVLPLDRHSRLECETA